ncbi:MAG: hypothetical protein V3R29_00815 [Candidatus Acidoferrales bacterium]
MGKSTSERSRQSEGEIITARRLLESLLETEESHADDWRTLLER